MTPFKLDGIASFLCNPHSHPNSLYLGHQCSWTLTQANSMQVSNMQSDDYNGIASYTKQISKVMLTRWTLLKKLRTKTFCYKIEASFWQYTYKSELSVIEVQLRINILKRNKNGTISVSDAQGKLPDGVLLGNVMALGSYSSCMDVNVKSHQHNNSDVEGFM